MGGTTGTGPSGMSKEREGEIAVAVLKQILTLQGVRGWLDLCNLDLSKLAEESSIPIQDLQQFVEELKLALRGIT